MKVERISNYQDLNISDIPMSMSGSKREMSPAVPVRVLAYKKSHVLPHRRSFDSQNAYSMPEYNLYEICVAEDGDGIIRRAIQKKRALADKEGWSFIGNNNTTIGYMESRFRELSLSQNYPMELLIKDTMGDMVRFHNAFWRKVRDPKASSGKLRRVKSYNGDKSLNPVAGYFRMAPETMMIMTDKYGNPKSYMQMMPDGRYEETAAEDIVHFIFNRRAGFNFAAPGLLPCIDDIRTLRRIEESVEMLIDQHLFPLFTLTIGSDQWPIETYPDGTTEVDLWVNKINTMPNSGGLVVSHRHKFDLLETKQVLPVVEYLEYFKKRVYTSAGVSNIDMGDGSGMNRSTAENASQILIDDVKDYQQEFTYQFEFEVIYELLLEKFTANVLNEDSVVHFKFNEIDKDSMIKSENHNALMYSMNYLSENEMRQRGKQKVIDDGETRQGMYLNTVEKPRSDIATNAKIAMAGAKGTSQAQNRNKPTNQHGSKSGPTGRQSSMQPLSAMLGDVLRDFETKSDDITKIYVKNWTFSLDIGNYSSDFCIRLNFLIDELLSSARSYIENKEMTPIEAKDYIIETILSTLDAEHANNEE